jgi:hypothetical protein
MGCKKLVSSHSEKEVDKGSCSFLVLKAKGCQSHDVSGLESWAEKQCTTLLRMKEWWCDYDCMPSCAALFIEVKLDLKMQTANDGGI